MTGGPAPAGGPPRHPHGGAHASAQDASEDLRYHRAEDAQAAVAAGADAVGVVLADGPRQRLDRRGSGRPRCRPALRRARRRLRRRCLSTTCVRPRAGCASRRCSSTATRRRATAARCESQSSRHSGRHRVRSRRPRALPGLRGRRTARHLVTGKDGGTGITFAWQSITRCPRLGPLVVAGGSDAGQRRRGDRRDAPVRRRRLVGGRGASSSQGSPRSCGLRGGGPRGRRGGRSMSEPSHGDGSTIGPDARGFFGPYGGRFVPETVVPALDELDGRVAEAQADPGSAPRSPGSCATTWAVRRRSTAPSASPRRWGWEPSSSSARTSCHTGAHKINNTIGQCLLAKRMGKTARHRRDGRGAARRGDGHGGGAIRS